MKASPQRFLSSSGYVDGKLFVYGGYTRTENRSPFVGFYDVSEQKWIEGVMTGGATWRYGHRLSVVNNKIFTFGGKPEALLAECTFEIAPDP